MPFRGARSSWEMEEKNFSCALLAASSSCSARFIVVTSTSVCSSPHTSRYLLLLLSSSLLFHHHHHHHHHKYMLVLQAERSISCSASARAHMEDGGLMGEGVHGGDAADFVPFPETALDL
eukprot:2417238-Rhodomonas_salina.1